MSNNVSPGMKVQIEIMKTFRYKIPKLRIAYSAIQEKRRYAIAIKNIKTGKDFEQQFNDKVVPYWNKYGVKPNKKCFKVFYKEGEEIDPRYVSNDMWISKIIPHYNNIVEYVNLANKSFQNIFVKGLSYPDVVVKRAFGEFYDEDFNYLTNKEACALLKKAGNIILKQSIDSYGGLGVEFYNFAEMTDDEIIEDLKSRKEDFVIQKLLVQHPEMAKLNPTSVNTIRFLTFFHDGEVRLLSANMRIGAPKSKVDNTTSGGYACGVHEDGRLYKTATSRVAGLATQLPNGIKFEEFVIPNYEYVLNKVKYAARNMPYFKIVGWDIAIDENGEPRLIEFNIRPEQNQKTCGPTFGELSDKIFKEVFLKD